MTQYRPGARPAAAATVYFAPQASTISTCRLRRCSKRASGNNPGGPDLSADEMAKAAWT